MVMLHTVGCTWRINFERDAAEGDLDPMVAIFDDILSGANALVDSLYPSLMGRDWSWEHRIRLLMETTRKIETTLVL